MNKKFNIPDSVRQKLLNRAKKENRSFNELLQYYAMERFLYLKIKLLMLHFQIKEQRLLKESLHSKKNLQI